MQHYHKDCINKTKHRFIGWAFTYTAYVWLDWNENFYNVSAISRNTYIFLLYKLVIYIPFNIIIVSKTYIYISQSLIIVIWRLRSRRQFSGSLQLPIAKCLSIVITLLKPWFVTFIMSICGAVHEGVTLYGW